MDPKGPVLTLYRDLLLFVRDLRHIAEERQKRLAGCEVDGYEEALIWLEKSPALHKQLGTSMTELEHYQSEWEAANEPNPTSTNGNNSPCVEDEALKRIATAAFLKVVEKYAVFKDWDGDLDSIRRGITMMEKDHVGDEDISFSITADTECYQFECEVSCSSDGMNVWTVTCLTRVYDKVFMTDSYPHTWDHKIFWLENYETGLEERI